jgi:hypothetical protein
LNGIFEVSQTGMPTLLVFPVGRLDIEHSKWFDEVFDFQKTARRVI